jgi:hypothetical protein
VTGGTARFTEEPTVRHALITTHLLKQAREAAIAQAEADRRLDHQPKVKSPIQAREPGRFARVAGLARRVRALTIRTS